MPELDAYRLKQLRELRGFTQGQVATYAHVSPSIISLMEKGERINPTAEVLSGIADALNTSADYLLGLSDNPRPPDTDLMPHTELEWQIFETIQQFDPRIQRFILGLLNLIMADNSVFAWSSENNGKARDGS